MKKYISCKSPSKLNLFLNIKGKREDGFHDIETVLEKIPVFDKVTLTVEDIPKEKEDSLTKINVEMHGSPIHSPIPDRKNPIPEGKNNTAFKAASIFVDKFDINNKNIDIKILKKIPTGAGLGGASSNAAVVLKLLDRLFNTNLSPQEISSMGKDIGSDVPFFLRECNFGFGSEKGDKIEDINSDLRFWHLLIYPGEKISTPVAYRWFDEYSNTLTKNRLNVKLFTRAIVNNHVENIDGNLYNSFERIIYKKSILLSKIRKKLLNFEFRNTLLTGSGSVIYSLFFSKDEAEKAKQELDSKSEFPYFVYGPIRTMDKSKCKFNYLVCEE